MDYEIFKTGTKAEMLESIKVFFPAEIFDVMIVSLEKLSREEIGKIYSAPPNGRYVKVKLQNCECGKAMKFTASCADRKRFGIVGKFVCECGRIETVMEEKP